MTGQPPPPNLAPEVRLVEARHGHFYVFANDTYVGRSLQAYGEWTEDEVRLLCQALRPGDCVLDIGANVGSHTIPFAKAVGATGRVLAFEPQPRVFQLLAANVTINGLGNAQLHQAGCDAQAGVLKLPELDYGAEVNFGGINVREIQAAGESAGHPLQHVPLVRVDDVYPYDQLRVMKIDVEGMELNVLRGATRTIARTRPLLYVENEVPDTSPELLRAVIDLGYVPYWHVVMFYDAANFRGRTEDLFPSMGCVNNLCVPGEMSVDVTALARVSDIAQHPRRPV